MNLRLYRFHSSPDDTLGLLYLDDKFSAFTVEDEHRDKKIYGETRIPAGTYEIKLTNSPKFGRMMPEIVGVSDFTGIRIHSGNDEGDTEGCIVLGNAARFNHGGKSRVEDSKSAVERIEPLIISALRGGEKVYLTIYDRFFGELTSFATPRVLA